LTSPEVFGQQLQNTTNATQAGPALMTDLTESDFEEITDDLNSARQAVKDNDPAEAIGDLGSAETEARVLMIQIGGGGSHGGQELSTVLNNINMAQEASGNNDTLKAFQEINKADTELLKIIQKLPSGEDEND
jgi:hypothetical protein